jgi:hypothetical protein
MKERERERERERAGVQISGVHLKNDILVPLLDSIHYHFSNSSQETPRSNLLLLVKDNHRTTKRSARGVKQLGAGRKEHQRHYKLIYDDILGMSCFYIL